MSGSVGRVTPMLLRPGDELASRALSRVGATLCGRYRLVRLVGVGGMAAVYAGLHRNGRTVAIKILHDRLSSDPEMERRFRREARLANTLDHPGVVPVTDDDVSEDGCFFLVMPLLVGETVRARAERLGGRLPIAEVLSIAHAVLDVLAQAHARKIVHRDIKPENLFVTQNGEVRVLDFGIAKFFETVESETATRSGRALGTPAFMAPEQALGRRREVDARSDIWGVGATMFTLLSGRLVHVAESGSETLVLAATRPPQHLKEVVPEIETELGRVVDVALAFARTDRWATAAAMGEALNGASLLATGFPLDQLPRIVVPPRESFASSAEPTVPPLPGASIRPGDQSDGASRPLAVTRTLPLSTSWPRTASRSLLGAAIVVAAATAGLSGFKLRAASHPASPASNAKPAPPGAQASSAKPEQLANAQGLAVNIGPYRQAWLDGDATRVRQEAEDAAARDPSDARAHLSFVVATHFWPDEATRAHFKHASDLRDKLEPTDARYLDAIAPGMTVPPDFRLSIEKLTALFGSNTDDIVVRMALADMKLRVGDLDGPSELLSGLANGPAPAGLILSRYAHLAALRDDTDTARNFFGKCLVDHPGSQVCAEPLVKLEMYDGNCAAAERILRKQISVSPDENAFVYLADVLERQGTDVAGVAFALKNWTRSLPEGRRDRAELQAEIRLALMKGQLRDALSAYDRLGHLIDEVSDDPEHFYYTASRMVLEADLGDERAAKDTLSQYEAVRAAFQRDVGGEDNVSYLQALGTEFSVVPWKTWTMERDFRLAHPNEVDDQLAGRARSWLQHYAIPTATEPAAREALEALPRFLPLMPRSERYFVSDAAIARVYSLVGRDAEAKPYLERATSSCNALDDLVQFRRAQAELAELYVRSGETEHGCAMYGNIVRVWPPSTGSTIARRASTEFRRHCLHHESEKKE